MRAKYIRGTAEQRFWPKVDKTDSCWIWTGAIRNDGNCVGYGVFNSGNGKTVKAHRFSYVITKGEIPKGLELDHQCHSSDSSCPGGLKCFHRRCVNPDHLMPVTHLKNASMSSVGGRIWRKLITHCPKGHEYTTENTYITMRNNRETRSCKKCRYERNKLWRIKRKFAASI